METSPLSLWLDDALRHRLKKHDVDPSQFLQKAAQSELDRFERAEQHLSKGRGWRFNEMKAVVDVLYGTATDGIDIPLQEFVPEKMAESRQSAKEWNVEESRWEELIQEVRRPEVARDVAALARGCHRYGLTLEAYRS